MAETEPLSNSTSDKHEQHVQENEDKEEKKDEMELNNDENELVDEDKKENNDDDQITVAVTGASGFIASHCIKQLLQKGYNVRGTVRGDPSSPKYKWLYGISDGLKISNKIKLFKADLLSEGSFTECFKECDYILHLASPVPPLYVKDPLKELVEPAKHGTMNVLNCALNAGGNRLKRIVITSSCYAVNCKADSNKIYSEIDWNQDSNLQSMPYAYSKTEAEKIAWKWNDDNKENISFDMVAIHPTLVIGEHLNPELKELNLSNNVFGKLINGDFPVIMNISFDIVDVRDVAATHILMIEDENAKKNASGRYICSNYYMHLSTMVDYAKAYYKENKISTSLPCCRCDCSCCWCFLMLIACCQDPGEADFLRTNVNRCAHWNNEKLKSLGFQFRDIKITLNDTLHYLAQSGFVGNTK